MIARNDCLLQKSRCHHILYILFCCHLNLFFPYETIFNEIKFCAEEKNNISWYSHSVPNSQKFFNKIFKYEVRPS